MKLSSYYPAQSHIWVKIKEVFHKKLPKVAAMTAIAPAIKYAMGRAMPKF